MRETPSFVNVANVCFGTFIIQHYRIQGVFLLCKITNLLIYRCENTFDETKYLEIKNQILIEMPKWRTQGFILNCDVEVLISLIDQLAGGSRFFSEETAIRVEDACMEIEEIINCLGS